MRVIKVRHYKAGYEIRYEALSYEEAGNMDGIVMRSAYTPEGYYIGSSRWAHRLIVRRGIKPEPRLKDRPEANGGRGATCSIGFCEGNQKWYGWSHRAICGFSIGDKVDSDDHLCACSGWTDEWLEEHPEDDDSLPVGFVAETIDGAKRMAVAFAASVA